MDISEKNEVEQVFEIHGKEISFVIHLAGLKSVSESVEQPFMYWKINLVGTINLLQCMQTYNVSKIIFSSSATVYGSLPNPPSGLHEDMQITTKDQSSPYGATKFSVEEILRNSSNVFVSNTFKLKYGILRFFNPVGAHSSGLIGEDPKNQNSNLCPIILDVLSGKREYLSVFGSDYETPDGSCLRDYIHVMDLARAHLKTMEYLIDPEKESLLLNVGTGKGVSVFEMILAMQKVSGKTIPYQIVERRSGDVKSLVANTEKIQKLLGWKPECDLDQICKDAWNWKQKNPNGFE